MAVPSDDDVETRPLSVAEIIKQANDFDYNPHIRLLYLLRSADTILKEAEIYEREGNDQQAFLLLYRHAQFVLNKLAKHPESRKAENSRLLSEAHGAVMRNMKKLEAMKPRINKRYERYLMQLSHRRKLAQVAPSRQLTRAISDNQSAQIGSLAQDVAGMQLESSARTDPALYGAKYSIQAGDNKELAIRIAHKEIRRRDATRRAVRQAGVSEEEEHERRTAGLWGNWESELVRDSRSRRRSDAEDRDDLSKRIVDARRHGEITFSSPARTTQGNMSSASHGAATSQFSYPTVPKQSSITWNASFPQHLLPNSAELETQDSHLSAPIVPPRPPLPPPIPSKELGHHRAELPAAQPSSFPPPRPEKIPGSDTSVPTSRSGSTSRPTSTDLNSGSYTFRPAAYLENGTPLRTVFLSSELRGRFLQIVASNTARNLETCGMLCGTLISNALFISKLVLPKQESTSDTCEMTNESELFDYVDAEDLMVLGWIHTHPTQTCFMSSRDLHTHAGFQAMMSESIAIVCAPSKQPSWGIFRLTDPPGMKTVLSCKQTGVFHPHHVDNIYTDALKPGHVCELPGLEFDVEDLRLRK